MGSNIKTQSKKRREYNSYVADETIEDYSLRYTPKSFRKFSELLIANTAMGSISFLALEAIGASIAIDFGFTTAFWAIFTASVIIFLTALPISYHAAKYNIDIDLITRSAGFGYVGSTITSLIYASFSFIFFALEASILAQALELYFGLPLFLGYIFSSLIIIPLTFYGITFINKLQLYTQPIWILLMLMPFVAIVLKDPSAIETFMSLEGAISKGSDFNLYYFGFALGISLSLIAQIGEQVDYLRFMPPLKKDNAFKWWFSVLLAGPGWIILGFLKQMGGIFLASIVLAAGFSVVEAKTPIEMYNMGYTYIFENPHTSLLVATLFVIVSQIKINVTNSYAGSLAWSNFFSRITHSHPGRVVWMVFNISIALLLMEFGLFDALSKVLGLYSNVAIAWIGAITADLLINKPFGLSPKIIEFKRAYLHNVNPVGMGSMGIASVISIIAFMGFLGDYAQSYSAILSLFLSLTLSPLIAYLTKGKYYIARVNKIMVAYTETYTCQSCGTIYEKEDMAFCPLHDIYICSLCCSLDSLCHDACKKETKASLLNTTASFISSLFLNKMSKTTAIRFFGFFSITSFVMFLVSVSAWMIYDSKIKSYGLEFAQLLEDSFTILVLIISVLISVLVWWGLLLQENRRLAETELEENNANLFNAKSELEKQQELYELVFKNTESGVVLLDVETNQIIDVNDAVVHILKYDSKEELLAKTPPELSPEFQADGQSSFDKSFEMNQLAFKNGSSSFEWINLDKSGHKVYVDVMLTPITLNGKAVLHTVSKDITLRKENEQKLVEQRKLLDYQAHHDNLTTLPNRLFFQENLKKAIYKAKREKNCIAIFFIDLDRFKQINDSLGHQVGDKVLQEVAFRLKNTMREMDTLARLGGDEFTILMEGLKKPEDASTLAKKIITTISEPFLIDSNNLHVSTSIGISLYPNDSTNSDELLMYADTAMYKAKDDGRKNFQFYASDMTKLANEKIDIETKLYTALDNEEFVVYYQPQVDAKKKKLTGMEALIRWQHPQDGLIPPYKFLDIAQENGLIVLIDLWVMKTAMNQFNTWVKQGLKPGVLALNLTLKLLHTKDFISTFKNLLKITGCKAQWIELEVTESNIMLNPEKSIALLEKISDLGVELAIDDFGTGYSSLSYLKRLPLDKLKIDKSFVDDLPYKDEDIGISKAIIALASSLNLSVIAEGVETKEQVDFLLENDCSNIQGYYFAKPMPSDEMEKFMKKDIDF